MCSCDYDARKNDEKRLHNNAQHWILSMNDNLSIKTSFTKTICFILLYYIYKILVGLPGFARDLYCQLCLFVSLFLCCSVSVSVSLCLSVSLCIYISPLYLSISPLYLSISPSPLSLYLSLSPGPLPLSLSRYENSLL